MTIRTLVEVETQNNVVIDFLQVEKEYRIDSRSVAPNIGIEHHNFIQTLRTYQEQLEHWGILLFQTEEIKGRGQPEKYAMLNRNQALFAITLSRNTEQVVEWKMALIDALDQLEKQLHPVRFHRLSQKSERDLANSLLEALLVFQAEGKCPTTIREIQRHKFLFNKMSVGQIRGLLKQLIHDEKVTALPTGNSVWYTLTTEKKRIQ